MFHVYCVELYIRSACINARLSFGSSLSVPLQQHLEDAFVGGEYSTGWTNVGKSCMGIMVTRMLKAGLGVHKLCRRAQPYEVCYPER